jgi:cytoskeletal protein CcmA (bactofilin family)
MTDELSMLTPLSDANVQALDVSMGTMSPDNMQQLPTLPLTQVAQVGSGQHSKMDAGFVFNGTMHIKGACTIGGVFNGNLYPLGADPISVVVTETGVVNGDIEAAKISVMGHTKGVLNSGAGEVVLFETAKVQGLVRYGRIQVRGADLNATLERIVAPLL